MAQIDQCLTSARADSNVFGAVCSLSLTVTSVSAVSINEDIHNQHLQKCSESHFMSILPFDLSKTSAISHTHRTVKVFTATRQNKLGRHCGRIYINIVQQNVHTATIKTLSF